MKHLGKVGFSIMLLAMATLVMIPHGPAAAITCGGTSSCTFELTHSNVTQLDGNVDVRVTWNNTGGNTVFEVQYVSGGPASPKAIAEFGFNFDTTGRTITVAGGGLGSDWTTTTGNPGPQIDGFGNFKTDVSRPDGTFGITAPILFSVSGGKITSIAANDMLHNADFVVHLSYNGGCSGFISDGTVSAGSMTSNANCDGGAAVPEPGTLALFGTGLVGLGTVLKRRFFGHK